MPYKSILLIIFFLFLSNCKINSLINNKQFDENRIIISDLNFVNKGFALIYDDNLYKNGIISRKIDDRSLIIFQKNLKKGSFVKVKNILNNKSLMAKVGKDSKYPLFNNSVLSSRIADELDLNANEPYVEIMTLSENTLFIAKRAKTYDEEKNVASKAPVSNISINNLLETNIIDKKIPISKFSYEIKIADFYFKRTAVIMLERINDDTRILQPKIKEITKEKYRVFLGPFNNINSLQKSFNDVGILKFENIEIIKND